MTPPFVDEEAAILAELKKWGEDNVRHLLASNQLSLVYHGPALRWIEEIDRASTEESERRKHASQAEQIRIARSAKNAAWIAAIAAIIAAIIAMVAATSIAVLRLGAMLFWASALFRRTRLLALCRPMLRWRQEHAL
jgi:hypothetical protein